MNEKQCKHKYTFIDADCDEEGYPVEYIVICEDCGKELNKIKAVAKEKEDD